jgi:predicted membrane channel-forming protein YqfA (hemolysin III family)
MIPNEESLPSATREQVHSGTTSGRERPAKYSRHEAASGYSTATGVGAGFSLAAVVLVFTIAGGRDAGPRYFLAFATAMFTVGAVGLVFCSFSYATLSSADESKGASFHEMLNGSALTICFLAELAGFDALARPHLSSMRFVFVFIICGSVICSPVWIWLPRGKEIPGDAKPRLFAAVLGAGIVDVAVSLLVRSGGVRSGAWYQPLALVMLTYVGVAAAGGAWLSDRGSSNIWTLWVVAPLAVFSLALMGWLIASLP